MRPVARSRATLLAAARTCALPSGGAQAAAGTAVPLPDLR